MLNKIQVVTQGEDFLGMCISLSDELWHLRRSVIHIFPLHAAALLYATFRNGLSTKEITTHLAA